MKEGKLSQSNFSGGLVPRAALAALLSAPLALLTACGGGGGGNDAEAATAVEITITEANQQAVAGEAVGVTQQGATVAGFGGSLVTAAQVNARAFVPGPVVIGAMARRLLAMSPQVPAAATGVEETVTVNCTGGGTAAITVMGSGGSAAVVGDGLSMLGNNCIVDIEGTQVRLNGRLTLTIAAGSFDPDSFLYPKDVTIRMAAENFSMNTTALGGSASLHLVQASANSGSVTMTSSSFTWKEVTSSGSHTVSLSNYSHRVDLATTGTSTTQVSGTVTTNSPQINAGLVSFEMSTPTPLVANSLGVVTAGSLQVVGKASSLLLTTTANDTFSLQVDTDGNGTFDSTRTVTRSQL
jgi:hypothetical protein